MRYPLLVATVVLTSATGCELYFGHPAEDDYQPVPDSHVWIPPDQVGDVAVARCEDGNIYDVYVPTYAPNQPGHGAGTLAGHCAEGCRSAAVVCSGGNCSNAAETLCNAPASQGKTCDLQGTACSGSGTLACPESTTCGYSVQGSLCTCTNNSYQCAPLTAAADVQAAIVGKWSGTVNPPSFSQPYQVSLWIYADGTYWAESSAAHEPVFYYGGDGPYPDRKITVLSTSAAEGSWADIGIYFGSSPPNTGAISALAVDATHLRFTFFASWFGCGQPFYFDLTRV